MFWLFRVSYLWYSGIGCVATLLAGLIVSVATGVTDPSQVPIDLISPPVVTLLNSLPNKVKVRKTSTSYRVRRSCHVPRQGRCVELLKLIYAVQYVLVSFFFYFYCNIFLPENA